MSEIFKIKEKISSFVNAGSERSAKARKNVLQMLLLKGGSILCGFLMVPATLHYVDTDTYGIWLTLSSMVAWVSFFDIGINNGLKNRLAEAWASGDETLAKKYVSTTYAMLSCIFLPLMVILLVASNFINWENLLNISSVDHHSLVISVSIIITYFCINFILSTINVILQADQNPAYAALLSFIQQVLSLVVICLMTLLSEGNLVYLCIGLCVAPILVMAIFNRILFRGKYKSVSPSRYFVDFSTMPNLLKLGVQFFIIQIAGVIQYQMLNFIIMRYYGGTEVTNYNIAYKYFSAVYMIWGILIAPLWVAVTDAKSRGDYEWIKSSVRRYLRIFSALLFLSIVMLFIAGPVYGIWVGSKVSIPFLLSLWVMIYNVTLMFGSIFVMVLNGFGELKLQTILCVVSPVVFILAVYYMVHSGFGVYAVLAASVLANFNGIIVAPLQCRRLLKRL